MMGGLPGDECTDKRGYGYEVYWLKGGSKQAPIDPSADLCALARQKGFCRIIIFDGGASEEIAIRTVACDDCVSKD